MYKFLVATPNEKLPFILPDILKSRALHIETKTSPEFSNIKDLSDIIEFFESEFNEKFPEEEKLLNYDDIEIEIKHIYNKYQTLSIATKRLDKRTKIIQNFSAFFEIYPKAASILKKEYLFFIIDRKDINIMNEYIDKYQLLGTYEEFKDYVVYFLVSMEKTTKNIIYDIVNELGGHHFFNIVKFAKERDLFDAIETKKWALIDAKRGFNLKFIHFKDDIRKKMGRYKFALRFYREVDKFKAGVYEGNYVSIFSGWLPEDKIKSFETVLKKHDLYYELYQEKFGKKEIPVQFSTSKILAPFNELIKQYGNPRYGFINPLIIFTIIYTVLFGFMFGDMGHGGVIFLFGVLMLFSPLYKKYAALALILGSSSIIFGFLFGSFFGKEEIINPLLFKPVANFQTIMIIVIFAGIFINIIGMLFNIYQKIVQKDHFEMIFGEWGLLSLVFYLELLIIPGLIFMKKIPTRFGIILLICLIIIEILIKVFWTIRKEGLESGMIQTILISIWFIEFLSNTLSFIRVAAFLLAHVALSSACYMIIKGVNMDRFSSILLLIIWNAFVILLEGLVVFVQSMRLNFYEFFSKFFTADGIEYDPLKI
jgi:V/A-type H+-transporting ATPase subunit I